MDEILRIVRELNRAFNHNAEPVFVNTKTGEVDIRYAPSLQKNPIPPHYIRSWMEGNYGVVHPSHPNVLFFAVDRLQDPDGFGCCTEFLFLCDICHTKNEVTPEGLARHEWLHSLQLKLNPGISHGLAENIANDLELLDIARIASVVL